jgi:glutamine amidotransferase
MTIINYGSGNIRAIANIYDRLNIPYRIADSPDQIRGAKKIILPGVGAFDETMSMLDQSEFRSVLDHEVLENKVPVLGICVGMQILAEHSDEGDLPGLGWIKGGVKRIKKELLTAKPKLPHLGWNSVKTCRESAIFRNVDQERGFYFLHSYYFECQNKDDILSETYYGKVFASSVQNGNIFGVQFHPEKSHNNGVSLLKNFAQL